MSITNKILCPHATIMIWWSIAMELKMPWCVVDSFHVRKYQQSNEMTTCNDICVAFGLQLCCRKTTPYFTFIIIDGASTKSRFTFNKLASLEGRLDWNTAKWVSDLRSSVDCRATSVAENFPLNLLSCKLVQKIELLRSYQLCRVIIRLKVKIS